MTEKKYIYIFLLPILGILFLLTIYPTIYTVFMSFHRYLLTKPYLGHPFVGFENYLNAFAGVTLPFLSSLKITFIYTFSSVAISMSLGIIIALLFTEWKIVGGKLFQSLFLLPMVLSPVVAGFFWRFMYNEAIGIISFLLTLVGLPVESILGGNLALVAVIVVDIWQWTPFVVLVCIAGLTALPTESLEAALIDGAGKFQIIQYVILPMLKPVILVALLFRTIDAFRAFDSIYILTGGGPGTATLTLTLLAYKTGFVFWDMGACSAYGIMMLTIAIMFSNVFIKLLHGEGYEA